MQPDASSLAPAQRTDSSAKRSSLLSRRAGHRRYRFPLWSCRENAVSPAAWCVGFGISAVRFCPRSARRRIRVCRDRPSSLFHQHAVIDTHEVRREAVVIVNRPAVERVVVTPAQPMPNTQENLRNRFRPLKRVADRTPEVGRRVGVRAAARRGFRARIRSTAGLRQVEPQSSGRRLQRPFCRATSLHCEANPTTFATRTPRTPAVRGANQSACRVSSGRCLERNARVSSDVGRMPMASK